MYLEPDAKTFEPIYRPYTVSNGSVHEQYTKDHETGGRLQQDLHDTTQQSECDEK